MPTPIAPSFPLAKITELQKAAEVSKPAPLPSLAMGEKLNVLVLGGGDDRKTLLQIKNSPMLAETPLPLRSGETLTVRVDQLHPTIVLRTIPPEDPQVLKANESLRLYRSNPGALKEVLLSLKTLLDEAAPNPLSPLPPGPEVQNLYKALNQIILSKENITNPMCLKDCIAALGLTGEWGLMKALTDPGKLKERQNGPTLKEILLKLSAESSPAQTAVGDKERGSVSIKPFSDLADQAATVIESLQIVNVLAQEKDALFILQIPVQFPDGIRMQELFVEADRGRGVQGAGPLRVVLFLDMDSLGELAVDMGLKEGTLSCTLKCPNQEILDFMQPLLPALCQALSGDYAVGSLQCVQERNIGSWKQEFLQDHTLFTQNSIDVSI